VVALAVFGLILLLGVVVFVATDHGTVQITVDDPEAVIRVDGSTIRIEKIGEAITLTLRAGTHELLATRGDLMVKTRQFNLTRDGREAIRVEYIPSAPQPKVDVAKTETRVAPPEPKPLPKEAAPAPPRSDPTAKSEMPKPTERKSNRFDESICIKMKLIPAAEFEMGSPDLDHDAGSDEKPRHRVQITRPFYLGVYEVTQGQYRAVTGENPSHFKGSDDLPVEKVSWNDAIGFCNKLSERDGLKPYYRSGAGEKSGGDGYRLPTEAEWEYACRAGSKTRYCFGDDAAALGEYAWYDGNSGNKTHPVGQKHPNRFGLYDMHGNVWEWCLDNYDAEYYKQPNAPDPRGPSSSAAWRVFRGGSWYSTGGICRSAIRNWISPEFRNLYMGFRVARVPSEP
jgi:formylglycine-generating enzyme required for sulfatase activity